MTIGIILSKTTKGSWIFHCNNPLPPPSISDIEAHHLQQAKELEEFKFVLKTD